MPHALLHALLVLCTACAATVTAAGFLAPLAPSFEMINHFRPFIVAGVALVLAGAVSLRAWPLTLAAAACLAVNASLALLPLTLQAHGAAQPSANRFRLITFNVLAGNTRFGAIETFLRSENADIVVLQEVTRAHEDGLLSRLRDLYPHQLACERTSRCHLAILSRTPWTDARASAGGAARPGLIWARFSTDEGSYRIAATHFAAPSRAGDQAADADWLAHWRSTVPEPLIVAGDFNLTPYSWRLSRFALDTGLRRYATYQASWPATVYRPAFLIDHVFSSSDFRPIVVRTGPYLGSDHLPVVADVAFGRTSSR